MTAGEAGEAKESGRVPSGPVLFASVAHPGQMNPLLAIVGELSRRGVCDLWFASDEDARERVEAVGTGSAVSFVSPGERRVDDVSMYAAITDESLHEPLTRGPMTTDGLVAAFRMIQHPAIIEKEYPWMLAQIDTIEPSLMVIDAAYLPALDAAMTRQVPFILTVTVPVSGVYARRLPWRYPTPTSGLPLRMTRGQLVANAVFRIRLMLALLTGTNLLRWTRWRRALGIANPTGESLRYSAAATAVFGYSVFGLEYPFPAPDHLHMLGAMVPPNQSVAGTTGELSEWLDQHSSVVYVSMGTLVVLSDDQLTALARALASLGPAHHVLWKLPAAQQARLSALSEPLPTRVRVEDWVPSQIEVLAHPHVRAFVTHGGSNGFHEGIYFGKPLLVTPFWFDCYDWAARAVDAGVGLALDRPPHIDAAEVTAKLHRLLSENSFRQRSQYWGEQLRKAGGVSRAADLILAHRDHVRGQSSSLSQIIR